jgi:hypothetical protein
MADIVVTAVLTVAADTSAVPLEVHAYLSLSATAASWLPSSQSPATIISLPLRGQQARWRAGPGDLVVPADGDLGPVR